VVLDSLSLPQTSLAAHPSLRVPFFSMSR
jgi:hypothetical protein